MISNWQLSCVNKFFLNVFLGQDTLLSLSLSFQVDKIDTGEFSAGSNLTMD